MTTRLEDNVYNRSVRQDQPKLKLWHSAGLMLTYGCSARCACCYVFCGPDTASPDTEMSEDMAIACWQGIRNLAGPRGQVHLTGGEPFMNYPRLLGILQRRCELQLEGLEKIETNAYWCTDEQIVRQRLEELKATGPTRLQVSTDIYHQEYIPIEQVQLAVRVAQEVLGEDQVQVRWRDFLTSPIMVAGLTPAQRAEAFQKTLARRGERLLGRAAEELASLFLSRNYNDFADINCRAGLLGAGHVHVDGAGNVFMGTCVGIITGRVATPVGSALEEVWKAFDFREHPIWSVLVDKGPFGLAELAQKDGFVPEKTYAGKCHLCYAVRCFLYHKGVFRQWLGPANCYKSP